MAPSPIPSDASPAGERAILAAILLLALALRLVLVLQMRSSPFFEHPALDQGLYVEAGRAVAAGHELHPGPIFRPPLYGWFLGLVFKLFGEGLLVPRLLQVLVGTATVWLVHRVGKLAFDARVGLVAALFAATYWPLVYYDGELLREPIANPLNLLGVLATIRLARSPSRADLCLAGLAFGFSALLRPQVLALVPFLAAWLLLQTRVGGQTRVGERRRVGWKRVLAFLALVAAPILPITAYNAVAGGDFLLVSGEAGQGLWIGNHPGADGVTPIAPGMRGDFWGSDEDTRAFAEMEAGRPLRASEVSRHYVGKTLAWFRAEPAAAARLLLRKLRLFWTDWEFGNPEEPRFFAQRFAPLVRWLPLGFGLVVSLAAVGLLACTGRSWLPRFPVWGFVLVYGATVVLSIVSSRYRLPVMPFLLILAAQGLVWLAQAAVARAALRFTAGVLLGGLVYAGSTSFPVPRDASEANGLTWIGIAEAKAGHHVEAVALFEEAIELFPTVCDPHVDLAATLLTMNQVDGALAHLRRALELCPDNVQALDALTDLLLKLGRTEEARGMAEHSIEVAPHLSRARYNLGRILIAAGRGTEAAAAFRAALERKPDYFNAAYALGMVSLDLGKSVEAIEALERAVACDRDENGEFLLQAYASLVETLARAGRRNEARECARKMVERFPEKARARELFESL